MHTQIMAKILATSTYVRTRNTQVEGVNGGSNVLLDHSGIHETFSTGHQLIPGFLNNGIGFSDLSLEVNNGA